ncbi:hypothetical protein HRH59_02200 [Rheinheimera sp. YQF-2]|uniref:DUF4145 domain-containing protein n=1 Tax=Rheinheimera lutimaris TaxID=2740584 RepID=A0A7Y5EGI2_9GAMM|nr:hypothetical protein [Rheinheimera lutimaris]NRQ41384.1 hypothetical protein [Rheinheimera lutimaris]
MNTEILIERVEELITLGNNVLKTEAQSGQFIRVDLVLFYQFRAASMSFILKLFGLTHPYFTDFSEKVSDAQPSTTKRGIGILSAVKGEIENGWLTTTRGLISADIFADFLEMAEHQLNEGYKDPAAILAGTALEQHLRILCKTHQIDVEIERNGKLVPKKADVVNADLCKTGVYNKIDQKNVTYLLGIRNNAAHGEFEQYDSKQVELMIVSISDFIGRTNDT